MLYCDDLHVFIPVVSELNLEYIPHIPSYGIWTYMCIHTCMHTSTLFYFKQTKSTQVNLSPWPLIKAKQRNDKSHAPLTSIPTYMCAVYWPTLSSPCSQTSKLSFHCLCHGQWAYAPELLTLTLTLIYLKPYQDFDPRSIDVAQQCKPHTDSFSYRPLVLWTFWNKPSWFTVTVTVWPGRAYHVRWSQAPPTPLQQIFVMHLHIHIPCTMWHPYIHT
jgi:hypothetical protein